MKFIEFAIELNKQIFEPGIILLDIEDISGFEQIRGEKSKCLLVKKNGEKFVSYGNYRTLTNRFFYALSKKHNIHEDEIMRPSIKVFHRLSNFECDSIHFDPLQVKAFIFAIDSEIDLNILPTDTQLQISKL